MGQRGGQGNSEEEVAALLPLRGTRRVLLLGLEGSGKSSFLWLCEHPGEEQLPIAERLTPTAGVARTTRKAVPSLEEGCSVDLDLSEVGGGEQFRQFWPQYITREIRVLAFFVSASVEARLDEAAAQFATVCDALRTRAPTAQLVLVASRSGTDSPPREVHAMLCARAGPALEGHRPACVELALGSPDARASCDALLQTLADLAAR